MIQTQSGIPTQLSIFQQQGTISWHHPVINYTQSHGIATYPQSTFC